MAKLPDEEKRCAERKIGRPRCPLAHQKILAAVFDELAQRGYGGLTIESVAHRAGVGKATIYRRWSGKAELLLDALMEQADDQLGFQSTGEFKADLQNHVVASVRFLQGPQGDAFRAIFAAVQDDGELAEQFRTAWFCQHREGFAIAVEKAQPESDPAVLYDLTYGPIFSRMLFGLPLSDDLVDAVLNRIDQSF